MDYLAQRTKLRPPGPVIDVHVHPYLGANRKATPREAAEFLIQYADRAHVTRMVLMDIGRVWARSPKPADFRQANDECAQIRDVAPDRFVPFVYVNPAYPDESVAEIDRGIKQLGFFGVKLWVAVRASDPRVARVVERAVVHDVPVLQHVWYKAGGNEPGESTPADVAQLARAVPHAKIIMGHLHGGGLRGIEDVAAYPNVVVETGGSDPEAGIVEAAVRVLGSNRVIFGSDAPGRAFGTQVGKVLGANLTDATKKRILWDNLARLLPPAAGVRPNGGTGPTEDDVKQ